MYIDSTANRLKKIMKIKNIKQVDILSAAQPYCNMYNQKLNKSDLSQYISGKVIPGQDKLKILSLTLNVSPAWLMGLNVPMEETALDIDRYPTPKIVDNHVTFPVIGEIAAGYDSIALEDWDGDTVDIPLSYLKGRAMEEYFVLQVKGDSMYPTYQEGDKVLILKTPTLDYSGQVGAVLYDNEYTSLKKVEFVQGEDWMRLVAINPNVAPKTVEGEELEHCKIIGIPKILIRDIC